MSMTVTVDRIDLERTLARLARDRYSGVTPGEAQAEQRLRDAVAGPVPAPAPIPVPPPPPPPVGDDPEFVEVDVQEVLGETYNVLVSAGFDSYEAIVHATDEELLGVDGIGPARLRKIRELVT